MKIPYTVIQYKDIKINSKDASKLRGFFGNLKEASEKAHNHSKEGVIYKYPEIQYKVLEGTPTMIGVADGAKEAINIGIRETCLKLGNKVIPTGRISINTEFCEYGVTDKQVLYKFVTPWVALNQQNARNYNYMSEKERKNLLNKILIGNIISMSKSLGYEVTDKLCVDVNVKSTEVFLKGVRMDGFVGEFKVNFILPEYIGLGRSVSRGFGAVSKFQSNKN